MSIGDRGLYEISTCGSDDCVARFSGQKGVVPYLEQTAAKERRDKEISRMLRSVQEPLGLRILNMTWMRAASGALQHPSCW